MKLKLALITLGSIFLISLIAPLFCGDATLDMNLSERLQGPSISSPFGFDQNGIDVFKQVIIGAQTSLFIALLVTLIASLIGVIVGSISGFFGSWVDQVLMRVVDIFFAFPGLLLVLTVAAVVQATSVFALILTLSFTSWAGYARIVRGEVLHLKQREYVNSAKALGARNIRQIITHILPNTLPVMGVQMTFGFAGIILSESSLTFLGFGIPATQPSWGSLLSSGRQFLWEAPHMSIFPGLALFLVVFLVFIIGDALREKLYPRPHSLI